MARKPKAIPYRETVGKLFTAAWGAVQELDDLLTDDDSGTRLRAAAELLKAANKAYELHELTKRIEALEAKQGAGPVREESDGDGDEG